MSDSEFFVTDASDPEAPRKLNEYNGLRPGMLVNYRNPAWRGPSGAYKTGGMDGPLMITDLVQFPDPDGWVTAILNNGEWEVDADNLQPAAQAP